MTSLSALKDCLGRRPEIIEKIQCKPEQLDKIKQLLTKEQQTCQVEVSHAIKTAIAAWVRIELFDEADFLQDVEEKESPVVLFLDHISDPRNFGAILRTCAFYNVDWLVVAKDRQALLTDASVATAQAGYTRTSIAQVTNLTRVVTKLKSLGYWVFGMDGSGERLDSGKHDAAKKVLILGAEDKGLSHSLKRQCDFKVGFGPQNPSIDSLNVSVACGIALNSFMEIDKK